MRILKIHTLPSAKTWQDKDEIMLHACFQLLTDFVEKENGDTHCNYETHKDFVDEVRVLYNWWRIDRVQRGLNPDLHEVDNEMLTRLMKIRTQLWT